MKLLILFRIEILYFQQVSLKFWVLVTMNPNQTWRHTTMIRSVNKMWCHSRVLFLREIAHFFEVKKVTFSSTIGDLFRPDLCKKINLCQPDIYKISATSSRRLIENSTTWSTASWATSFGPATSTRTSSRSFRKFWRLMRMPPGPFLEQETENQSGIRSRIRSRNDHGFDH